MEKEVIETRIARLWMGDDGIIRVVNPPNTRVTLEDIKEVNRHIKKLCAGKKVPIFNDIRGVQSITREARLFTSSEESMSISSAAALLIGSSASKVIGNFFLGLNKPPYPTRLFTSENEAIRWLKEFI